MDVTDRLSADLAFARQYAILSNVFFLAASAVLLSAVTTSADGGISVEAAGGVLVAPWMLALLCFLEIAKIVIFFSVFNLLTLFLGLLMCVFRKSLLEHRQFEFR